MKLRSALLRLTLASAAVLSLASCTITYPSSQQSSSVASQARQAPRGVVEIPVLVRSTSTSAVPQQARIVIADIVGDCAEYVKDALMRRLIDNLNYNVLTRDNLAQIMGEADRNWGGRFNSETAAKIGDLLGASLWIVGRVAYCGEQFSSRGRTSQETPTTIIATLQLINIDTGEVLVSSSSEGTFIQRELASILPQLSTPGSSASTTQSQAGAPPSTPPTSQPQAPAASELALIQVLRSQLGLPQLTPGQGSNSAVGSAPPPIEAAQIKERDELKAKVKEYTRIKAADDLANGFADKFFSRPTWETVEVWENPLWEFGKANHLIKLGRYETAIRVLEEAGARELHFMNAFDTAEYLHNYGVALICVRRLEEATKKLRAAYRISNSVSTLKMLGLAARMQEWAMDMPPEDEPATLHLIRLAKE